MAGQKPRSGNSKEPKQSKKDSQYEKNEMRDEGNIKDTDRRSLSGGNDNPYPDSDEFMYDK